jgi:hypothetical protein
VFVLLSHGRIHNNDEGMWQYPELTGQRLRTKSVTSQFKHSPTSAFEHPSSWITGGCQSPLLEKFWRGWDFFLYFIKLNRLLPMHMLTYQITSISTLCIPFLSVNCPPPTITDVSISILFNQSHNISGVIAWWLEHFVSYIGLDPYDPTSTSV